jgi:hypothetical protein
LSKLQQLQSLFGPIDMQYSIVGNEYRIWNFFIHFKT